MEEDLLEWVRVGPGGVPCEAGDGHIEEGAPAVKVATPPGSMTSHELAYRFHNGDCVAKWAEHQHSLAEKAINDNWPAYVARPDETERRSVEMESMAKKARLWTGLD